MPSGFTNNIDTRVGDNRLRPLAQLVSDAAIAVNAVLEKGIPAKAFLMAALP